MGDRIITEVEHTPHATTKRTLKFISAGFEKILCSEGVHKACMEEAERVKERANANYIESFARMSATQGPDGEADVSVKDILKNKIGYKVKDKTGKAYGSKRAIVLVQSADRMAAIAEAEDKALSRAVDS